MKKVLFLSMICLVSMCTFAANNNEYYINDQKVEQLFTNSVDASLTAFSESNLVNTAGNANFNSATFKASDKSFVAAILLNFFLGGLGIHRLYLGTETLTWVGYILTCGGIFGIVPLVDFIVLIIHNDDLSPYIDNPKFFMWAGGNM
jgi:TM2 domain-containing membrane protein YozV